MYVNSLNRPTTSFGHLNFLILLVVGIPESLNITLKAVISVTVKIVLMN